jgi:pyruvate/2-oxoglutarate dehydrogenase complex dihydrolipoamide dehydrogenase (E3) component
MKPSFDYDVAVIGGGSSGYAAARMAAGEGQKTVLVEGGEEVGGLCILRGCMPTKALLYAAEVMHLASHPQAWGICTEEVRFNWRQVLARKDTLIEEFADYRRQQLENARFRFVRAHAAFADAHALQLSTGERLTARNIIIATGSSIAPCPLAAISGLECLNSDTALRLERLPRSLIILGGGAVAVEFAQMFARFGVKVSLIQRSTHVLHEFDSDATAELESAFRAEGITVYTGTKLLEGRGIGGQKQVTFEHNGQVVRLQAEEVFYALGRAPNIASLGHEKAGLKVESGRIATDPRMRTSLPHIYAVGDCTGLHEIVHIGIQQGEVAGFNAAHPDAPREMDYRLLTEVIFTDPQVAVVGMTEKKARARNVPYLAASYPFSDHGKAIIMGAKKGFVKLLAEPQTGQILGGCCIGPAGGDLIHEIIAAMSKRMTVGELAAMPHYHPTLAEIWTYPAEELAARIDARPAGG